jgi:hypothetical protein
MRALGLLALLLGATLVSATALAQEKKEEKKLPDPTKKESYTEKVSVRRLEGGALGNALPDVPAFRFEKDGAVKFYTHALPGGTPNKGTEITDKDGAVYVVESVFNQPRLGFHVSTVKPKPKPKP